MTSFRIISMIITGMLGMGIIAFLSASMLDIDDESHKNITESSLSDEKETISLSCENGEIWTEKSEDGILLYCECEEEKPICEEVDAQRADIILEEYWDDIDYSCSTDLDCTVKDIHDCCGYYPACVNKDFNTKPELVQELCDASESMPRCGFPTINECRCVDGRCVGEI